MNRPKILFIVSKLGYGGAEKMITFLANELVREGYNVSIYSYEGGDSNYKLDDNIQYLIEKKIQMNYLTRRFIQVIQVRKAISDLLPDLVISFLTNQNVFSILGTRFSGIPVIISERGDPYSNTGVISKIKYFFYRYAEGIVFQTEGARDYFNKRIIKKSIIIPNPVISYEFKLRKNVENKIVNVGRFDLRQKRQDVMVKAFQKVHNRYPNIKLYFYGDGQDLDFIKNMVKSYDLCEYVVFKGKVDNVLEHILNAKMFVLTSDFEGIPNSLIEAMSIGLPVVSTKCRPGGAQLLIKNGINGLLTPRGDIDKVADSILYLLDNPDFAKKIGKEAQKIINDFSSTSIVKMWNDYIHDILSQKRKVI